jgi:hypothetical protein
MRWHKEPVKAYVQRDREGSTQMYSYSYRRFKKCKSNYFCDKFSSYRRLVKATIRSDKLQWLKGIGNNLKTNPVHFWKYVSSFKKSDNNSINFEVDGNHPSQPCDVAEAFAEYFNPLKTKRICFI